MEIKKQAWWLIGGVTLASAGVGSYFLFFKEKASSDEYGNLKLKDKGKDKKKSGGVKGGIVSTTKGAVNVLTEPNWKNPFAVAYKTDVQNYLKPKEIYVLKPEVATEYAKEIKEAKGAYFYSDDNEEQVLAVFKKLKDKVQLSNVSKAFLSNHKEDLYDFLESFLSEDEMKEYVWKAVNKLESYRLAK